MKATNRIYLRYCFLMFCFFLPSIAFAQTNYEPDLAGEKGVNIYFALGALDDYLGRSIVEGSDKVEHYYCGEHLLAFVFGVYLHKIARDQNMQDPIEIRRDDCHVNLHSASLSRLINSFYEYEYSGEWKQKRENGEVNVTSSSLSYDVFRNQRRDLKLAYLSGAYYRYNLNGKYNFANSSNKARLILRLLEDVGCTDLEMCIRPAIPSNVTVKFEPTVELLDWFENYPSAEDFRAADSLVGTVTRVELSIYKLVLEQAEKGSFDGCRLEPPYVLPRLTNLYLKPLLIPELPPTFEEALADYREKNNFTRSLWGLEGDSFTLLNDIRGYTGGYLGSLFRIGYSNSGKVAVVILGYHKREIGACHKFVAVFLKKNRRDWEITDYIVRQFDE